MSLFSILPENKQKVIPKNRMQVRGLLRPDIMAKETGKAHPNENDFEASEMMKEND